MEFLSDFFNDLISMLVSLVNTVLVFLPDSPFKDISFDGLGEFMGYLNFFIPIPVFLNILGAWLSAITIYYIVSLILRWVKAIE